MLHYEMTIIDTPYLIPNNFNILYRGFFIDKGGLKRPRPLTANVRNICLDVRNDYFLLFNNAIASFLM